MINAEFMLDLETMDTERDAAVTSIGACVFDPFNSTSTPDDLRKDSYFCTVSLEDNVRLGRTMSPSTVVWWMQQADGARLAMLQNNRSLLEAISGLRRWIQERPQRLTGVWAKGPSFDCVIIKSAFKSVREMWPMKYWEENCVRTIERSGFPNYDDKPQWRIGDHHNALDDAITQALMVQRCYKNMEQSHT
jgi:exodeoxyribonuclease VIII